MHAQDFAKFVASQQDTQLDQTDCPEVSWDEVRTTWLRSLESLYSQVVSFLDEFVRDKLIQYSFHDVELNEENLGTYTAKQMEIRIGRQHVRLEPIGTLLIASRGRVDVVGSAGQAQLLLVNQDARGAEDLIKVTVNVGSRNRKSPAEAKPASFAWKIVRRDIRTGLSFSELDKESFFSLLMEIAGA